MRLAALSLALAGLAIAAPGAGAAAPTTGRLLVSLKPERHGVASAAAAPAVMARAGARHVQAPTPQTGLEVVRPAAGESPRALADRLRRDPRVRAVSAEHRATLRALPDDPALTAPETAAGTPPGTTVEWWPVRE